MLVTKYRRKVINQEILNRLHEIFTNTCEKWNTKLTDFNGESDHVHLVIDFPPDVEISKLVNNLKTVSSRLIRKEFLNITSQYFGLGLILSLVAVVSLLNKSSNMLKRLATHAPEVTSGDREALQTAIPD